MSLLIRHSRTVIRLSTTKRSLDSIVRGPLLLLQTCRILCRAHLKKALRTLTNTACGKIMSSLGPTVGFLYYDNEIRDLSVSLLTRDFP